LKDKTNELANNSKNNNIRDLYRDIREFKTGYQPRSNLVKELKYIILPVVLHGCDTLSATLRKGHGLRVFENRMLRRIFGTKRDEVKGEQRKLHSKKFLNLYSLPNIF
jgi:hypothetical protein